MASRDLGDASRLGYQNAQVRLSLEHSLDVCYPSGIPSHAEARLMSSMAVRARLCTSGGLEMSLHGYGAGVDVCCQRSCVSS